MCPIAATVCPELEHQAIAVGAEKGVLPEEQISSFSP